MGSVDLHQVKDKAAAKQILMDAVNSVPEKILMEMCQLTKANSIEGCKASSVDIVYTPFLNLKKEDRMDVGQVGFKDESFRLLIKAVEKDKDIVKRLEKTQKEEYPFDFRGAKERRDAEERRTRKLANEAKKAEEKEEEKRRAEQKELKSYAALQTLDMTSNENVSKTGTIEEARAIE